MLVGQVVLEVSPQEGSSGMRFSAAKLGIYAPTEGASLWELVGRSVTAVEADEEFFEICFSGGKTLRINLAPEVQSGPEAYCLSFEGGPIVVG